MVGHTGICTNLYGHLFMTTWTSRDFQQIPERISMKRRKKKIGFLFFFKFRNVTFLGSISSVFFLFYFIFYFLQSTSSHKTAAGQTHNSQVSLIGQGCTPFGLTRLIKHTQTSVVGAAHAQVC